MFCTARRYLPPASGPAVLVALNDHEPAVRHADPQARLIAIPQPTQGQADTTALGLSELSPDEPVLVSSCDHGLLWDPAAWERLLAQKPDVIVFGQKGYPGARRTPTAFSYLASDREGRLTAVSVKKPLTSRPHEELVLVGTFYFASASLLGKLIDRLKERDDRVNGERYLDSVLAIALEDHLDVRCFESQAYLNWGSPEALQEFTYWHRYFMGVGA